MADRVSTLDKVLAAQELYRIGVSRFSLPSLDAPASAADPEGATVGELVRSADPGQEEAALAGERRRLLAARMRTLLTPQEQVVVALRLADWSLPEVAVVIGRSRNTAAEIAKAAEARIGTPADDPVPESFPALDGLTPAELLARQRYLTEELGEPGLPAADRLALQREGEAIRQALTLAQERARGQEKRIRRVEHLRIVVRRPDLLSNERERYERELRELVRKVEADRAEEREGA